MKTFACKINYRVLWLVCSGFLLVKASYGQTAVGSQPAASQPLSTTAQTFVQEQQSLAQAEQALVAQGATQQQIQTWRTQNAARFAAQQQRAKDLATASASASATQPLPTISEVQIPPGASQEMIDFLTTQADLSNRAAQLHNQKTPNADAVFQQQNATALQAQQQRAQVIAAQQPFVAVPIPSSAPMPPNATPQMVAFLTLHNQLVQEEAQLRNQYVTATPTAREEAMQQWRQQNASRFQQLQQQAQNISATPVSTN